VKSSNFTCYTSPRIVLQSLLGGGGGGGGGGLFWGFEIYYVQPSTSREVVLWCYTCEREALWKLVVNIKYGSQWYGWCSNLVNGSYGVGL
jgi:hypothetical protein